MPGCCVYGCSNHSSKGGFSFFKLPTIITNSCELSREVSTKRRAAWLKAIGRKNVPTEAKVCSAHFHSGKPSYFMQQNNPDWAPSLKLHHSISGSSSKVAATARFVRHQQRKSTTNEAPVEVAHEQEFNEVGQDEINIDSGQECQTELSMGDISILEAKLKSLEIEVHKPRSYTEEKLKDNNARVLTLTGLPTFSLLKHVFNLVSEFVKVKNQNSALSQFEEFMMVMMRLRLNLIEADLADRFNVTQGTVSKIINSWLPVMANVLSAMIVWPERETLKATMPQCFRKAFGTSVTVIIDCFEIFIQRPSQLKARAQTWSDYKKHNTVKYLIGIAPQGTICFISRGWGGRSSDKFITEAVSSGFLDKLKPGDVIMADRGFNIGESVGMMQVRLVMPAFMNKRSQLSANDVAETREIANVRIHVERVIGFLRRKFHILSNILNISSLQPQKSEDISRIDQIVLICCALCNLCPPIVPLEDSPKD